MKTSLLAAALSGTFACAGHAQSSVVLYGVVDAPIEYVNHLGAGAPTVNTTTGAITRQPGGDRVSLQTSGGWGGSRWGLRGTEDLGNGLQSLFVLESGFGLDDGKSQQGGRLFGRQAYVGVRKSDLGTLTFGRQYSTMFEAFGNFAPLLYAPMYEPIVAQIGSNFRQDNMVKYAGKFGPLGVGAHWSFGTGVGAIAVTPLAGGGAGETPGQFRDNTAYGASLSYTAGRLGAAVAYDQWNPAVTVGNTGAVKKAGAALSYIIGKTKVMGGYRWGDAKDSSGSSVVRDDYYWIGVNFPATASLDLNLAYYYDNLKTLRLGQNAPATNPANPWQVTLLTNYRLSKRTDLYLMMAYVKNSGLNFDTAATGFGAGYFLTPGSDSQFGTAIGIRHVF
ncbi:porin [Cupriavidus sp. CuC1]|uniref:porin n=1 Tax=Cupriavidus sp. CuC1 TaxID=3373131 RepID=UPI0037D679D4